MNRFYKPLLPPMMIGFVLAASYTLLFRPSEPSGKTLTCDEMTLDKIFLNDGRAVGEKKAVGDIVEFFDYECPPCRTEAQSQISEVAKFQSLGLTLLFRHLPLQIHESARPLAESVESDATEKNFAYKHYKAMGVDPEALKKLPRSADALSSSLSSARSRVHSDELLAREIGVSGTPTFIIRTSRTTITAVNSLHEAVRQKNFSQFD